ncbi:splicing factor 3B subunit 2 [Trichonephila clavata]|uniref:Splicing factor 3B subunit 2 n=1 Tax=Trichonephila clavata TaxID=2740835 RepID=A0A8X6HQ09_TRICU|nr:splicing factor 3B subunit 2 [Trichonephila clavata]
MIVAELQQKGNLKASSNIILLPHHWCFKRKYSQGKRGIEKPAWELPDFIKPVGTMKVRQALQEREDQKTTKAKMPKRVRLVDKERHADSQKFQNRGFKRGAKSELTILGDLYYEGKALLVWDRKKWKERCSGKTPFPGRLQWKNLG